jgi:glycosyltransferase involved in cell wall biosynthesis
MVQLAGAIKHPDAGKRMDLSQDTSNKTGVEDASVIIYPTDGYGNPILLRQIIELENPDAIFLITDPRYFTWVFEMENELRKKLPIAYLNIWDCTPAPAYNTEFYESCDALFGISKQTALINQIVLGNKADNKIIKYVPHGLDPETFYPIKNDDTELKSFNQQLFNGKSYDFVLLFNSRNVRRKNISDTILAWKVFTDGLPREKAEKCVLVLHTNPVDENGTDLPAVIEYFCEEGRNNVLISAQRLDSKYMNYLYNIADGTVLLSTNEGWGLSLTESLLTGTPFIANVTGGMQDQMRFIDNKGNWFTPSAEIPSNHRGTFKKHGNWALPVFPSNLSLVGSVPTPYIFDDRCSFEDAALQIEKLYKMSKEQRQQIGEEGRQWALGQEAGFTSEIMSQRIIEGMDELFEKWQPRESYEFLSVNDFQPRKLKHNLIY